MSMFSKMEIVDFYYYVTSGDGKTFMQDTLDASDDLVMVEDKIKFISNEIDIRSTILN
tara:strand:+ start:272 stop:445 length:174 start_codon:yes stop_codon:yes gene_type:complete